MTDTGWTALRWGLALSVLLGVAADEAAAVVQDSAGRRFLDMMDRNRDDLLSRAEWTGSGTNFLHLDRDRDGYLNEDELAESMKKPSRRKAEPAPVAGADVDAVEAALLEFPTEPPPYVTSNCTACHNTDRILAARKDAGGWTITVERMAGKDEASIGKKDAERIARYLEGLRARAAARLASYGSDDPIADWGKVLDGAELHRFDRDGDGRLGGAELLKLLMDRVDFDGDGQLSQGEFCLMPVAPDRVAAFRKADKNRNGKVSSREMSVPDGLLALADQDGDGALSIQEIPRARGGPARLLLALDAETVLKLVDRNRDGEINAKELRADSSFLRPFDGNRDGKLDATEIEAGITRSRAMGFLAAFDDVLSRYDLDGDGTVQPLEFPGPALIFRRCDRDGDGVLSPKDTTGHRRPEDSPEARRWRDARGR